MSTHAAPPEPVPPMEPMTPEAIIRRRETLGWSQADLAHACSVTTDTIRRVEAGRANPGTRQLVTLTVDHAMELLALQPFPWER